MSQTQWFAVAVRTNRERVVAQLLEKKQYQVFLPLYHSRRVWSDRIKELELPLFPGYVFTRFDLADHTSSVVTTSGVVRIVGFAGKPVPVEEREIEFIRTIVASGLRLRLGRNCSPALPSA